MLGLLARPGLNGLSGGPFGLRGQLMKGARQRVQETFLTAGSATYSAPVTGWYVVLLYGPGGTGGSSPGTAASGGGGGGASLKRVWLRKGEVVSYTVAASGDPTTAALAGRFSFSAETGLGGGTGYVLGGLGGTGVGGDVNRTGGRGGGYTDPDLDPGTNDGVAVNQTAGEFGGRAQLLELGGAAAAGGGAGFIDILPTLQGDGGGYLTGGGTPGVQPGGGGSGGTVGWAGAAGAVVFIYET